MSEKNFIKCLQYKNYFMSYLDERRNLKLFGKKTEEKKVYRIPKVSAKRKIQIEDDKILFEQDKIFYKEIWNERPHVCECGCKRKLSKEPLTTFFHHLLAKSIYPQFRHVKENIMILHPDDHNQVMTNIDKVPEVKRRTKEAEKLLLGR